MPQDPLRAQLNFYHQSSELTIFDGDTVQTHMVDALEVAHTLAGELSFSTGLLPENTLWWSNTKSGAMYALYEPPRTRVLSLQLNPNKPPKRFTVPLPGFIFICHPGQAPWLYAVKKKPTKPTDKVYKAPLANVFSNGRSCQGSNRYPSRVPDIIESFFRSFFTSAAELGGRSQKFPKNIIHLWELLDGKKKFPMADLVEHGVVEDLMNMEMGR